MLMMGNGNMEIEKKTLLSVISAVEDNIRNQNYDRALIELAVLRKEINRGIE